MTVAIIGIVGIISFGVLVFTLIDREALSWGAQRTKREPQAMPIVPRPRPVAPWSARTHRGGLGSLLGLLAICGLMCAAYIGITIGQVHNINIGYESNAWPSVEGGIISSEIRIVSPRRGTSFWQPTLRYSYSVGGRDYIGELWRAYPNEIYDTPFARQFTTRYAPGTVVAVRYDPGEPTRAALEPGIVTDTDHAGAAAGWVVVVTLLYGTTLAIHELLKPGDLQGGLERVDYLRYQDELLRRQPGSPRTIPLGAFVRAAYPPIDLVLALPFLALAWFFLTPVLGTPAEWLVVLVAATFVVPAVWRLGRTALRFRALRRGALITAGVRYAGERAGYTYVELTVRANGRGFAARYRYTGPGRSSISAGDTVDVLVDPLRERVLQMLPPPRSWL